MDSTSSPSTRQLVALVALVVAVLAAAVALYALTPEAGRVGLWDKLTTAGPGAGALVGSVLAWLGVRRIRDDHGAQLATIHRNTNGVLDQRIRDGVSAVLADAGLLSSTTDSEPAADLGQ